MKKEFIRSNFLLACVLQCLGFALVDVRQHAVEAKKKVFVFDETDELKEAVKQYWRGELLIEPLKFGSIQKETRERLFDQ